MSTFSFTNVTWENLDWMSLQKQIFDLQCKLYEAMGQNDIKKVFRLQRLLLLNPASYYLALRWVLNSTSNEDYPLFVINSHKLKNLTLFSHINERCITKIGCLAERFEPVTDSFISAMLLEKLIREFVWKLVLAPPHEVGFSSSAYGFRPGFTCWDLQNDLLSTLNLRRVHSTYHKIIILQVDLSFQPAAYSYLMSRVILSSTYKRAFLRSVDPTLFVLDIDDVAHFPSYLLPLIVDIILDGLDGLVSAFSLATTSFPAFQLGTHFFRYANQILFLLPFYADDVNLLVLLQDFFSRRGVQVKHYFNLYIDLRRGFTFLDWIFRSNSFGKIVSYPSFINCKIYTQKIKTTLKSKYYSIGKRLRMLRVISKEWIYHNRFCYSALANRKFTFLKRWCYSYLRSNTKLTPALIQVYINFCFVNLD